MPRIETATAIASRARVTAKVWSKILRISRRSSRLVEMERAKRPCAAARILPPQRFGVDAGRGRDGDARHARVAVEGR